MNYGFDVKEFIRKVDEAAVLVKKHHVFREMTIDHRREAEGSNDMCPLPADWNIALDHNGNKKASFIVGNEL